MKRLKAVFGNLPLVQRINKTPMGARLLGDDIFRSNLALHGGLMVNLLYVALNLFSGMQYRSAWFITLAVYYLVLSLLRASLVQYVHQKQVGLDIPAELLRYRACGVFLLLMNPALVGIVIYIVYQNNGFIYPGLLIYTMATYTFYITIAAIYHVIKYGKRGSPILSATKVTNLATALVSMLSLETAMLTKFGSDQPVFRRIMTAASGTTVCVIILGIAVYMIVHSTKQLKTGSINPQP